MEEEVKFCIDEATEKMDKAISHLQDELMRIRAGKATTALLDGITVDYYSVLTPLNQVSNLSTPDAKTIIIHFISLLIFIIVDNKWVYVNMFY